MPRTSIHEKQTRGNRQVALVITLCGDADFVYDALRSCKEQTILPAETILVVGDRQQDLAKRFADSFLTILVHREGTGDRSFALQSSLAKVNSEFVIFLDASERLTPMAIEVGLDCFEKNPGACLAWGAHRVIDGAGRPASGLWRERIVSQHKSGVSGCAVNAIAMQAAVMYRVDYLRSITSFEAENKVCFPSNWVERIATHCCCVAEYRADKRLMLARSVIGAPIGEDRSRGGSEWSGHRQLFHHNAPQVFAAGAREIVSNGWNFKAAVVMMRAARMAPFALLRIATSRAAKAVVQRLPRSIGQHFSQALWVPNVTDVQFGDFERVMPISDVDGYDRGRPIDRYYIERALAGHLELIHGRVLEVAGRDYTKLFGAEKVVCSEVLDIDPLNANATIIGDLGVVGSLPEGAFDCIVLTQTLQFIYNLEFAIENLYRALAPGGSLLITVPGISPIGKKEIKAWYWDFTELSLKTMLGLRFSEDNVKTQSYGNVFAAICFLSGLSLAEVDTKKLDYMDERYPVIVSACARKPREGHC